MAHIVVVDDDDDFRRFMHDALSECGWEVTLCPDTLSAYAALNRQRPDLLILDVRIETSRSGWEILTFLQLHPHLHDVPAILCTASIIGLGERQHWLQDHGVALLSKPFELGELYALVEERLQGHLQASTA